MESNSYVPQNSYLKSVFLWLQEYWTGPSVRVYPLRAAPKVSRHQSVPRSHAKRVVEVIDLPPFLPAREGRWR
jgi:hypothetical protein